MIRAKAWLFRAVALLSLGAFALHQARFALAYGHDVTEALALQGHSYMPLLEAVVAVVVVAGLLRFVRSLVLASLGQASEPRGPSFARLWAGASTALLAVYTLQEGFEGQFSAGHPSGFLGIFGNGGWTAIPLAFAIGALVALLLEGADCAIALVSSLARRDRLPRPRRVGWLCLPVGFPKLEALSRNLAARGPPVGLLMQP